MREMNKLVVMSGRKLADEIQGRLKDETAQLRAQGITPGLATVLVGDDPPSAIYIAMKRKTCEEIGIRSIHTHLETPSQPALMDTIQRLNENPEVDAILVQIPLPAGMDEEAALLAIEPDKDADGLNPINLGRLERPPPYGRAAGAGARKGTARLLRSRFASETPPVPLRLYSAPGGGGPARTPVPTGAEIGLARIFFFR